MPVLCASRRLWIWPEIGGQSSSYTVFSTRRPPVSWNEEHMLDFSKIMPPVRGRGSARYTRRGGSPRPGSIYRLEYPARCAAVIGDGVVSVNIRDQVKKGSMSYFVVRAAGLQLSCMTRPDYALVNICSANVGNRSHATTSCSNQV